MTADDFQRELQLIAEKYVGRPSTLANEQSFLAEVAHACDRLYAEGGMLTVRDGPIFDRDDVEIVVGRGENRMNVTAVRRVRGAD